MRKPKAVEAVPIAVKAVKASASKKPAKKAASKSVPKKKTAVTPKKSSKKAPANVLGKSIVITSSDNLDRKIQIVEKISANAKRKAPLETKKSFPSLAEFKTHIHLGLMTPFKMQVDQTQLVSNIARYAGTAFVVVGAFLTMYNMNVLGYTLDRSQQAQVVSTCTSEAGCDTSAGANSSTGAVPGTSVDTTPDVDISLTPSGDVISESVSVTVTVPLATRIDVIARDGSFVQSLGTFTRSTDLVWSGTWNTRDFRDGEYRLSVLVTNGYGSYTEEQSDVYRIENFPLDTTQSSGETTQNPNATNTAATTSPADEESATDDFEVAINMDEPLHDVVHIETRVEGGEMVRHYTKPRTSAAYTLLGNASLVGGGEWRYVFDTARLEDGEYDIRTQVITTEGNTLTDTEEGVMILNATEDDEATSTQDTVSDAEEGMEPLVRLELTKTGEVAGSVDAYIHVRDATFVELYLVPERALASRFLGLATRQSDDVWRYRIDTKSVPNGTYTLYANIRHAYGDTRSEGIALGVANKTETTVQKEEQDAVDALRATGKIVDNVLYTDESVSTTPKFAQAPELVSPLLPTQYELLKEDLGDTLSEETKDLLDLYDKEVNRLMNTFRKALRSGDTETARETLAELERARDRIIRELPYGEDESDSLSRIKTYMETITQDIKERTERSENIIKERTGEDIEKDSDADSVSDYDEINLYATNPFSADTDLDGYVDGIEILGGFDPNDATPEANVRYESPKDTGVVREDILSVDTIAGISGENESSRAHIGGTALPNSFVTLYIFSTPIVVTVKTDAKGNWSYVLDKELEDGEHQVYVGMTDNAGKIVAKSNPFTFVKTAEAFTSATAKAPAVIGGTEDVPALIGERAYLIIGSIAIVAVGLVLILIGLHVRPKETSLQIA